MVRHPYVFWDVDTQIDFMEPSGALFVPGADEIEGNLCRLTEAADRLSIPLIATADDHEHGDPEISDDPDFEVTFPPHCMRGTPGARRVGSTRVETTLELGREPLDPGEIRTALRAAWPRVLVLKNELDAFSNPNVDTLLAELGPSRHVVYGVALDFCVRRVVEELLARRVGEIVVLTDATRAIDAERGDALLEAWEAAGVELETTERFLGRLPQPAHRAHG